MTRLAIFLFFLLANTPCSFAQQSTGKITGQIIDPKNNPVPYATVTLLKTDSSVVNGDLTREDGAFSIESVPPGRFLLRINIIGFRERFVENIVLTPEAPSRNLSKIKLTTDEQQLEEVQIVGEKAMMELQVDKKVFNVEKNITATGGSATDVLQNVPSLTVDQEGNVSLRGKSNVTILIDGKPATLLGGDNASALQSLPASSIAEVEVITNPSAKFDAQGMTGIVNIITRKDKKLGLNGTASVGVGTRDKYNASLNLNLKDDKWNLFFNSSFRKNRNTNRTTHEGNFYDETPSFYSLEESLRTFGGWFNTLGAEYALSNRTTIMLTQNLNKMSWGGKGSSFLNTYESGLIAERQKRTFENEGAPLSSSTALNIKHKFQKPRQEISADLTYAKTWVNRTQEFVTSDYDGNETLLSGPVRQSAPGDGTNRSVNAQADFTTPFLTKTDRLDAGWKSQLFSFESSNDPIRSEPGKPDVIDVMLLNSYEYTQDIHAAYLNYADQRGKWSYQAGLRMEYALYEGTTVTLGGQRYSNEFFNLFPSAFVSYRLPAKQSIYLSYTRRTNRPHFHQMMPYLDISNLQDTSSGNPDLVPEFIHNAEINYSRQFEKGHNFIAGAYYQYTENLIERYRRFNGIGTFSQPRNLASGVSYGLELIGKAQILPIWDATLNLNFFQREIKGENIDPSLQNSGFSWFGKLNTTVRLPKGFSLQINGSYEAPEIEAQGVEKAVYFIDAAIRKSFWKNNATIVLNVSDIFNTRKYTRRYELEHYYQLTYRDRETRVGNITFTYRFGKADMGKRRQGGNGENRVKDRMKSRDDGDQGGF